MTRKRNRNRKRNNAFSCDIGFGSRSYRLVTGEGEQEPIPEPSSTPPLPATVELHVMKIDSTSASGCEWIAAMTSVDIKHSAIVVFGLRYEFSQEGVEVKDVLDSSLPKVDQIIQMGSTERTPEEVKAEVERLRKDEFRSSMYNSLFNNCHTFSNHLSLYLTENSIPKFLLDMSKEVALGTAAAAAGAAAVVGVVGGVVGGVVCAANALARSITPSRKEKPQQPSLTSAMNALAIGGVSGLAALLLSPTSEEAKPFSPMNALAIGDVGGLAASLLPPTREEPKRHDESPLIREPLGQIGLGGLLAAGAANLAAALSAPREQPKQQTYQPQLQWLVDDDSEDDDWFDCT